jgi:hypothetical protein
MADNVVILDADGNRITVGADEVTSRNGSTVPAEKIQREKVGFGGDGTYQDVSAATPLPVTDTQGATLHTDLAALLTELAQKLEPSDLNLLATAAKQDVAHADLGAILTKLSADPATQTTLASILTKLTTTAGAPLAIRVSDGTAYLTLATVSDRLKVDVGGSLPAGTASIGRVTTDVGTGPWPVTDNGGSLTVDGTVGISGTVPVSIAAAPLPPAAATPFPIAAGTGNNQITSTAGRLMGFTVAETTGTAGATVRLYSGTDNTGTRLSTIALAANESVRDWFGPGGITVGASGVFVERVSGNTTVTVYQAA